MSISYRHKLALHLVDLCNNHSMNDSYGVNLGISNQEPVNRYSPRASKQRKSFWKVTFAISGVTSGIIRVYSPNLIVVTWMTVNNYLAVPSGKKLFKTASSCKAFLIESFSQLADKQGL